MRKLRLDTNDLAVQSFATHAGAAGWNGTVDAHAATPKILCDLQTVRTNSTCCPCTPRM